MVKNQIKNTKKLKVNQNRIKNKTKNEKPGIENSRYYHPKEGEGGKKN